VDRSSILELFRFLYGGVGGRRWVRNTVASKTVNILVCFVIYLYSHTIDIIENLKHGLYELWALIRN
jgi:hypothetical protein